MSAASVGRAAQRGWIVAALGALLPAALAGVAWFDFTATRTELLSLLRAQAASVRETVAASARANRAAAREAEEQLTARLLDNARLLAELDARHELTAAVVDDLARRNHLFRVTVLDADGRRQFVTAPGGPGSAHGPGPGSGRGQGAGWGPGGPPRTQGAGSANAVAESLLSGAATEASTGVHEGRRSGVARLAAGARRTGGGAIVINVDAAGVASLQRQSSLDGLFDDIVKSAHDIGYVVYEQGDLRMVKGEAPVDEATAPAVTAGRVDGAHPPHPGERVVEVGSHRVLEVSGPVALDASEQAMLHLGMRLDAVERAERRMLGRMAVSLTAGVVLGGLALGLVWLRREYGTLSDQHRRAQEALRRRDRLTAMGELASTVAHEVRNPLNAIAMSAQRLRRECFDGRTSLSAELADSAGLVEVIQHEAQRIDSTVRQFLDFARPPRLAARRFDLRGHLEAVVDAMQPLAEARGLSIDRDLGRAGEAVGDPDQLRQVFDNLLRNAIEATPAGGRVTVSAASSGRGHAIEVADTGAGIAPEDLPRIFDLYFTTKSDGTGVGLAVSHQIVTAHGGVIEVESQPGRTVMRVRLPREVENTIDG